MGWVVCEAEAVRAASEAGRATWGLLAGCDGWASDMRAKAWRRVEIVGLRPGLADRSGAAAMKAGGILNVLVGGGMDDGWIRGG